MTYALPDTYTARLDPQYFNDTLADATLWQADVYRLTVLLARRNSIRTIVDIGCGTGGKLKALRPEFLTIGIDYGANIALCKQQHLSGQWIETNLSNHVIEPELFKGAVVICADVIEHIPNPTALLNTLKNACKTAAYVLVSTPDRERLYNGAHSGPPSNLAHVREWTLNELVQWFESEQLPIRWAGWTISYDKQPQHVNTSLLVLSSNPEPLDLPVTFQPAPQYRKAARVKNSNALKVWMTPTPSQAGRNASNAIHNIVLRLDKYLPDYGVELVEEPDNATLIAAHAGQGTPTPVDVAHYHGLYPTAQGMDGVYFGINKQVINNLKTAKAITAPSNWIADVIRRDMHVDPHVIGWGVDTDEWTPGDDPHLYVIWNKARVDAVCDPAPMLELAARAHDMLFLTTFGQGTPNVKTIGVQPYETMKGYVRNAAVYLSTNVETFGIGLMEAMSAGVPVLSFRQGAQAEYIQHGVNGFLAELGDMDGLYEGLRYCFQHRDRLGANARETAKAFTWEKVARQFADVYKSILEPHKGVKVSVVIPCHNYAQYLAGAIESALKQDTRFEYEVIVVLDRCTDNSAAIAHAYADKGVIALEADNGNLSTTRNDGIRRATGEYMVCLDADDHIGSEKFLQTLADVLDSDRTLGVAFTGITVMDAEGKLGHKNAWPNGYDFDLQAQRRNQIPSCCMFRKEAWRRAGGFRPYFVYAQDAEFWLTVGSLGYGAKYAVQDGWFHYRLHSNSQSRVHRTGEIPEPDWTEFHAWTKDNQRPFAADGKPPLGSWPVRFYDKPDVTLVIPVGKGHEESVKDALHSVEGQTYRMWECVVVNDTGEPLDLMGFPWARIVNTKGAAGAGAARNIGAKHSRAAFLVFLDADDMLKPRFLERTLQAYRQHGRYAYTDLMTQEQQTNIRVRELEDYSFEAVFNKPSLHPITALIPRAWFEAVGGFDEQLTAFEDVDFFMKMLTHGFCGVRVKEPLLIYNLDSGKRRKAGESQGESFRALLKSRYGAWMEGRTMCSCVEPPKGKSPAAPTPENAADYKETYGEMVKIALTWEYAPEGAATFKGPGTNVSYGRRAKNDVFYVWQADVTGHEDMFTVLENYETQPGKTVIPPAPPEVVVKVDASPVIEPEPVMEAVSYPDYPAAEAVVLEPVHKAVKPVVTPVSKAKPGRKPAKK